MNQTFTVPRTALSPINKSFAEIPIVGLMRWFGPPAAFRILVEKEDHAGLVELREEVIAAWKKRFDFIQILGMAMRQWKIVIEPRVLGGYYEPEKGGIVVCLHYPSWVERI